MIAMRTLKKPIRTGAGVMFTALSLLLSVAVQAGVQTSAVASSGACNAWSTPICQQPQSYHWNDSPVLGYSTCPGNTNSNYVWEWQEILYVGGELASSGIDGLFGTGTNTATKTWQTDESLTSDGCVGSATWNQAEFGSDRVCNGSLCDTYPHLVYDGAVAGGGDSASEYTYEQPKYTSRQYIFVFDPEAGIATSWDTPLGWWWMPGYTLGNSYGPCAHIGTVPAGSCAFQ